MWSDRVKMRSRLKLEWEKSWTSSKHPVFIRTEASGSFLAEPWLHEVIRLDPVAQLFDDIPHLH